MATNYQRGRASEYGVMDALKRLGYTCTRSASSKGLWDVVGFRADGAVVVQAKLTSRESFSEDENCRLLRELPVGSQTQKLLWVFRPGKGVVEVYDLRLPPPGRNRAARAEAKAAAVTLAARYRGLLPVGEKHL